MKHEPTDRSIQLTQTIACNIEKLWNGWTTNEGVSFWLVPNTKIELAVGGSFEIYFAMDAPEGSRGSEKCTILSYIPKQMLSFSWNAPPTILSLRKLGPCTWVVVEFEKISDNETKLKLTHLGIKEGEDWDQYLAYFESAWPMVLAACKSHFEK